MSSFMVNDSTINKIVGCLDTKDDWILRPLFLIVNMRERTGAKKLAEMMFKLNEQAVNARYGAGEAEKFRPLDFKYRREYTNDIKAFKALNCWLYQCSEGTVPETKLFKAMKQVQFNLAHHIVTHLPEYDKAEWG